jgi:hypothetical protein
VTRSLALLDNSVSKVSFILASYSTLTEQIQKAHALQYTTSTKGTMGAKLPTVTPTGKRKKSEIGYSSDEDVEQTRERFNRMRLVSADDFAADQDMD